MIKLLLMTLLFIPTQLFAEEPPEPEYPYPKTKKTKSLDMERPIRKDNRGGYYYSTDKKEKKNKFYQGVEKPYKVGDDGAYYYNTDKKDEYKERDGIESPIDTDDEGGYYYKQTKKKKKAPRQDVEQPSRVTEEGTYFYKLDAQKSKNVLSIRGGVMGPPNIQPVNGTRDFKEVYSDTTNLFLNVEYDWRLSTNTYIKSGFGLSSYQGEGQFANDRGITPKENFQFFVIPALVSMGYKIRFSDTPLLTPYLEGGTGYFGFAELRSDGKESKFGGALALTATGGLLISLSRFQAGTSMQAEYGITESWFDIQFKQVIGLDSRKDFTSNIITGGFAVGFQ